MRHVVPNYAVFFLGNVVGGCGIAAIAAPWEQDNPAASLAYWSIVTLAFAFVTLFFHPSSRIWLRDICRPDGNSHRHGRRCFLLGTGVAMGASLAAAGVYHISGWSLAMSFPNRALTAGGIALSLAGAAWVLAYNLGLYTVARLGKEPKPENKRGQN
jgi:hypothetical protein